MARSDGIPDTMISGEYSELKDFLSAYFHQDWMLEAEDPDQIVANYLAIGWSAEELNALATQVIQFTESISEDSALDQALLSQLGCYYSTNQDGTTTRAWLHHLASELRDGAGRTP
jgi:CdiI immunity protein